MKTAHHKYLKEEQRLQSNRAKQILNKSLHYSPRPDCVHGVHLRDQQYLDYSQKGPVLYLTEGQKFKQVIRLDVGWLIK